MKVCVLGLWHLGCVTAACVAGAGHDVIGLDFDSRVIDGLRNGKPPLFEPGLEELLREQASAGRLHFTENPAEAATAEVLWVAYDTPVDDEDRADVEFVVERVRRVLPHLPSGALVLLSSQLPVGSTRALEQWWKEQNTGKKLSFGYSPENLRLGKALSVFREPDRVVVGLRETDDRAKVLALLGSYVQAVGAPARIEWMNVESAEMTKHALNAFLAVSVVFINEVATLCEQVGADAKEVERGLKSESRIGPKAYLSPGGAFAGGTLARDIVFLSQLGEREGRSVPLLSSVRSSNEAHKKWSAQRLSALLGGLKGKTIAVWGLTYKPGTDTLRRSSSIELCRWLHSQGAKVQAYDPAVQAIPGEILPENAVTLRASAQEALQGAQALVVCTEWPAFRQLKELSCPAGLLVLDANRYLASLFESANVRYVTVGRVSG